MKFDSLSKIRAVLKTDHGSSPDVNLFAGVFLQAQKVWRQQFRIVAFLLSEPENELLVSYLKTKKKSIFRRNSFSTNC